MTTHLDSVSVRISNISPVLVSLFVIWDIEYFSSCNFISNLGHSMRYIKWISNISPVSQFISSMGYNQKHTQNWEKDIKIYWPKYDYCCTV